MSLLKNNRAFTLLELMFVILIISILTSLTAPHFIKNIDKASQVTDEANLKTLNTATYYCKYIEKNNFQENFNFLDNDDERMKFLLNKGYLDSIPMIKEKDMKYFWEINFGKWIRADQGYGKNSFYYIFENDYIEKFKIEKKLILPMEKRSYKVDFLFKLEDEQSAGGLLIDYYQDESFSYQGYVLQLEKNNGQGALVLRMIKEINLGEAVQEYTFNHLNSLYIPDKRTETGQSWWNSSHTLSFSINVDRRLEVYIDDRLLFDDFYLPQLPDDINLFTGIYSEKGNITPREIDIY